MVIIPPTGRRMQRMFDEKEMAKNLRELMVAIIEQCAQAVEDMPASVSLYENSRVASAVVDFKKRAIAEIRSLADPA